MSNEQDQQSQDEPTSSHPVQQQQQQEQGATEGHGGQGSDSAMKQLRIWEQRRAANSGGKRRQGPQ
jgi:hypothetical protein